MSEHVADDEFKRLAASVVSNFRARLGIDLNYDKPSIEWLDEYINRVGPKLNKEEVSGLATSLGAYLGETIIATCGGAWHYSEEINHWAIRFDDGMMAFPLSKVYKQLEGGAADSILSFFRCCRLFAKTHSLRLINCLPENSHEGFASKRGDLSQPLEVGLAACRAAVR